MGAGSSYSIALTHSSTRTEAGGGRKPWSSRLCATPYDPVSTSRANVDSASCRGSTKPLVPASTNVLSSVGPGIGTGPPPPSSAAEPDAAFGIAIS